MYSPVWVFDRRGDIIGRVRRVCSSSDGDFLMATDSEINKDMFLEINANDSRNQVKTVVKLSKVWAEIADVRSDEMPDVARLKNGGSTTDVSWLEGKTTLSSGSIGFSPNPWSFGDGSINCSTLVSISTQKEF